MYRRRKSTLIRETGRGWETEVYLLDPFHEMRLLIEYSSEDLRILDASARMMRFPYPSCEGAVSSVKRLKGVLLKENPYRELERLIGGEEGCTHLWNMAQESFDTLLHFLAERRKRFTHFYRGHCSEI